MYRLVVISELALALKLASSTGGQLLPEVLELSGSALRSRHQ